MDRSNVVPPRRLSSLQLIGFILIAMICFAIVHIASANASTVDSSAPQHYTAAQVEMSAQDSTSIQATTKKCSTKRGGKSLPWYYVDSMAVTQSVVSGRYQYRVETSPKRTITYSTGDGSYRYVQHHIDYVKMYDSAGIYAGKTVNFPDTVTYFYSSSPRMDFVVKAHVIDKPYVNFTSSCRVYF